MPIDTVQEDSGTITTTGTSLQVTLPSGATAGNRVVVFMSQSVGVTSPSGWTTDKTAGAGAGVSCRRSPELAGGETSWTFTFSNAGPANLSFTWHVKELSGLDPEEPVDASANTTGVGVVNGGTKTSGTTPLNAALNTTVFAAFAITLVTSTETQSWSGYTNGFEEHVDLAPTSGPNGTWLAVASKVVAGTTGQFETTATLATTAGTVTPDTIVVVYRAADSPIVAPLAIFDGFEWGTHGGIASHSGVTNMMGTLLASSAGTWGTNFLIQAASARTGSYGLRVVQSGAAAYVRTGNMSVKAATYGLNVRVVSATGTVVVAEIVNSSAAPSAQLLYDATNSKFGVRAGSTGTTSWQSGTTATNTWVWVDLGVRVSTSTWRVEWTLETGTDTYTAQTAAELTGQSTTSMVLLSCGANTAQTMTADFDDVCLSNYYVAYPLGPHEIRLLVPDTAATVTYSGTVGNFAIVASNATSTALAGTGGNVTTSGVAARLDEVPPTISSAADGVVQTATAASDYLQFPMAAPTLAADEIISGVRMLTALISTTGAGAGDLAIRGWDGSAETALGAVSQVTPGAPTAVSSTAPRWLTAMWQMANGWTETKLAAAALRLGFSGDATPDMGAEVLYLEYATRKAAVATVVGEAGGVTAEANTNPNTAGTRSITLDTPAGEGATLNWSVGGTPDSQTVAAASSHTEVLDAPDAATVDYVEVVSENEDPDRP